MFQYIIDKRSFQNENNATYVITSFASKINFKRWTETFTFDLLSRFHSNIKHIKNVKLKHW